MNILFKELFLISSLFLIITSSALIIILLIFGKSRLHFIWGLFNGAILVWVSGLFFAAITENYQQALTYLRIGFAGAIFISIFFFHVSTFFYPFKKYLLKIAYGQGLVFLIWNILSGDKFLPSAYKLLNSFYYLKLTSLPSLVCSAIWGAWIIFGFYGLFKAFAISSGFKRLQLSYLLGGMILGWSGGFLYVLPFFKIEIFPFGNFTIPIYCLIVTYAILRYRLMDINIVIKRTAVYSLSAGLLASLFIVFVLAMTKYLSNLAGITSFSITVIAALIIALLFNPLRNRIQTLVDKIFYKKTYDYYATIQKVSHELTSIFDLKRIYSFIGDTVFSTLGLKSTYLLYATHGESYRVGYSTEKDRDKEMKEGEIKIDEDSQVAKLLRSTKDIVIKDELVRFKEIEQKTIDNINIALEPFKGEAVVPVFIDDKLELLLILGGKLSGDIFTDEDVKLLNTISDQTAIAIKNARLYEEKVRSERLASIGMVTATFAHEIKNPLTSIKTFAQLLPERYPDMDFRETFSKIVIDSVNRIDGLITEFLDLSSGRISAEMNTLNITGLIDQIIDEMKADLELKKKKINIEKDYRNIKVDVLGDEKRLRQAFINIIMNGCQAIPEDRDDGTLRVSINTNEGNVDISITDNGEGIPTEDIPRIFEPFFSKKTIGAGLGLAITKKIIEDHYGKIMVESKFKKGTTFKITLPVKKMGVEGGNLSTT